MIRAPLLLGAALLILATCGPRVIPVISTAGSDTVTLAAASQQPVARSPSPPSRPRGILSRLNPLSSSRPANPEGALCGVPGLRGAPIPTIEGPGGCGVENPVRVTHAGGLRLSQPATIDCTTARALNTWVEGAVKPTFRDATGLRVAAHYSCRSRNNQSGARLSEHAKGRAIDISAILRADGSEMPVLGTWRDQRMKTLHARACGPFGTVLGPAADRFHADHFHFDTASYRSGSYCR